MDRNTLAATALNPLPFSSFGGQGATVDWSGSNTLYYSALAFNVPNPGRFYTVDQLNGDVSFVNNLGTNLSASGVVMVDIAIRPIPEPSSIALVGIGAAALALARRHSRKRA